MLAAMELADEVLMFEGTVREVKQQVEALRRERKTSRPGWTEEPDLLATLDDREVGWRKFVGAPAVRVIVGRV